MMTEGKGGSKRSCKAGIFNTADVNSQKSLYFAFDFIQFCMKRDLALIKLENINMLVIN